MQQPKQIIPLYYDTVLSVTTSDARCFDDDAAPWAFFEGAPGSSELLDDADEESSSSEDSTEVSNAIAEMDVFSARTWLYSNQCACLSCLWRDTYRGGVHRCRRERVLSRWSQTSLVRGLVCNPLVFGCLLTRLVFLH